MRAATPWEWLAGYFHLLTFLSDKQRGQREMGGSVWVCVGQHHGWFGAQPAEPVEMNTGVIKIPLK